VARERFLNRGGGGGSRKYKFCFAQNCQASASPSNFSGIRVLHILSFNLNEAAGGKVVWGRNPQRLAFLGIYYQNNPFLGKFQLKFCLKTFETCSLLYVSVLKCSILAIILFKY